ncbi:hypothetical protein BLNAU_23139 [Blattamonas nauphoetae]|uniref:Uncharacterized protein n=1 Tax=Blattamonas nauphoetae TaxID=2049346 RepID=A0ABQ9WR34_9EUKA|nr:hypothetical protein BLNAU_23139 [Blattamonas nauphoetae]
MYKKREEPDSPFEYQPEEFAPATPDKKSQRLLDSLLTPKRKTPHKSERTIEAERILKQKMGGERQEGLLSFSVEVPTEPTVEFTRNLTDLVDHIQPSNFVCAFSKIHYWRKGQEVSFSREERDRLGEFLNFHDLLRPQQEDLDESSDDPALPSVPEPLALSVPEDNPRNKKGIDVKKDKRKKLNSSIDGKVKATNRDEVNVKEETRKDTGGRMLTRVV